MPKNAVAITVDDGYQDFYDIAYPLLKELNIKATLFVTTGFVDREIWLWPDKVKYVLEGIEFISSEQAEKDCLYSQGQVSRERQEVLWNEIVNELLTWDNKSKELWIEKFSKDFNVEIPIQPPLEYAACSWSQLAEMQDTTIDIEPHSVTHPSLAKVDEHTLVQEIKGSMQCLNNHIEPREHIFCYPNGSTHDINSAVINAVENAGYRAAVVAFHDHDDLNDPFALRRHASGEDMFQFYKAANGVENITDSFSYYKSIFLH